MSKNRPIIGITMRYEPETERFYLARAYSEAVEAAGGVPLHISLIPREDYLTEALRACDGLLLPGSASDVDPLRYGREPRANLGAVHLLRDETDLYALAEAERLNLPVLAICFGMQSLNVARGGTLIQDIESEHAGAIKHEQGVPRGRRSHTVNFATDSEMAKFARGANILVNSHHHQAIETVGENLRATGWAADGIIEAVEDTRAGRWVNGVQWHPEIEWTGDALAEGLFSELIRRASIYKTANARSVSEALR